MRPRNFPQSAASDKTPLVRSPRKRRPPRMTANSAPNTGAERTKQHPPNGVRHLERKY